MNKRHLQKSYSFKQRFLCSRGNVYGIADIEAETSLDNRNGLGDCTKIMINRPTEHESIKKSVYGEHKIMHCRIYHRLTTTNKSMLSPSDPGV